LDHGEQRTATDQPHVSVVMSSASPTPLDVGILRPGEAPRGSIDCPYCGCHVVDQAKLLGQSILCPKCHASFNAPDKSRTSQQQMAWYSRMRLIGFVLLALGGIGALISLTMDTTVGVESQVNGWTQVERVNNIGRMDERRNWLIVSGLIVITGAVFVGFGLLADNRRPTIPGR
jgi:hypothetical protein